VGEGVVQCRTYILDMFNTIGYASLAWMFIYCRDKTIVVKLTALHRARDYFFFHFSK
jgi:hypothetical protein